MWAKDQRSANRRRNMEKQNRAAILPYPSSLENVRKDCPNMANFLTPAAEYVRMSTVKQEYSILNHTNYLSLKYGVLR
jgi:hypothetical protein